MREVPGTIEFTEEVMTRTTEWGLNVSGSSCSVAMGLPFGKLRRRTPSADPQPGSYNNGHDGLDELRGETLLGYTVLWV